MSRIISLRYQKVGPRASGDHITIYIYIYTYCVARTAPKKLAVGTKWRNNSMQLTCARKKIRNVI